MRSAQSHHPLSHSPPANLLQLDRVCDVGIARGLLLLGRGVVVFSQIIIRLIKNIPFYYALPGRENPQHFI